MIEVENMAGVNKRIVKSNVCSSALGGEDLTTDKVHLEVVVQSLQVKVDTEGW